LKRSGKLKFLRITKFVNNLLSRQIKYKIDSVKDSLGLT
jgi:hypothetical protein